jgi:hypothetical protein
MGHGIQSGPTSSSIFDLIKAHSPHQVAKWLRAAGGLGMRDIEQREMARNPGPRWVHAYHQQP